MGPTSRFSPLRIVTVVALAALVVAIAVSTRYVTPEELASMGPEEFDPQATSQELYDQAGQELSGRAAPLPEVLAGLQQDVAKAAGKFDAVQSNDTTYLFAVTGQGEVTGQEGPSLELKVAGVPESTPVALAQGPALDGTVLRDYLGFEFGDAPNQTAYQRVGDDLKAKIQQRLDQSLPDDPKGTTLRFLGLISVTDTGAPVSVRKPVSIQPVSVEVVR